MDGEWYTGLLYFTTYKYNLNIIQGKKYKLFPIQKRIDWKFI